MPSEPPVEITDPDAVGGPVHWQFDRAFLSSRWTCIWGRGCQGILDHPSEELQQGCCSVGAEMSDLDEAMTVSATAAALPVELWQYHAARDADDVFSDATRTNTKVVDGACIFLNRPGFSGGAGCAFHRAAEAAGERPMDWKPSVCWQLPIRVDWHDNGDGSETAVVRRWSRADWGDEGTTMAWCCTEEPEPYVGEQMVVQSLAAELTELCGEPVVLRVRHALEAGNG